MRAIVMTDTDSAEFTKDLEFASGLRDNDVRIGLKAAGVCGSDSSLLSGKYGLPLPVAMGHEGAGVVLETGSAVTTCEVGDHVILSTLANCGHCTVCEQGQPTLCGNPKEALKQPFLLNGEPVYQFAQTSCFSEETIIGESQAVVIPKEIPLSSAALVGCGVITGAGSVFNRAKVQPGDTVAVIGAGGVGLNVIQAARISGASRILVFDTAPDKKGFAEEFGATDFILVKGEDFNFSEAAMEITGLGVDHSFEVVGSAGLFKACIEMTRPGGNIVAVGVPDLTTEYSFLPFMIYQNKNILGCRYGAARPHTDFNKIVDLYLQGRFLLDELVSQEMNVSEYSQAFEDLNKGEVARTVLVFD